MMITWPEAWREILAWIVGGLLIFVLCFLATFPYGTLQKRLVAEVQRAIGMEVKIADWGVSPPLNLEWRNVTLSKPNMVPIQLAGLETKLGLMKMASGGLGLDVLVRQDDASSHSGLAKGTLSSSTFSLGGPVTVKGQLQQVDLSKLVSRYVTHGTLNGDFSHRIDTDQASLTTMKGDGTWAAEATDLQVDQIPLGNGRMLSLAFSKVSAGLSCHDGVCQVTQLKGEGIDGSFSGEGQITLQQPMQNSQLALTVTVIPGLGFTSKAGTLGLPPLPPGTPLTVKIVGTLAQARIAL